MTREEAIKMVRDAFDVWKSEYETPSRNDWSKEHEAKEMAINSLEAWDKVKHELKADWQLQKYPSSPFACGVRYALDTINKYLSEVSE